MVCRWDFVMGWVMTVLWFIECNRLFGRELFFRSLVSSIRANFERRFCTHWYKGHKPVRNRPLFIIIPISLLPWLGRYFVANKVKFILRTCKTSPLSWIFGLPFLLLKTYLKLSDSLIFHLCCQLIFLFGNKQLFL